MDPRRARIWEWLAGALGVALVVSLFLEWYGCGAGSWPATAASASCRPGATVTGWGALAVADVFMLAAGLAGVASLLLTLVQRTPAAPLALTSVGTLVAFAAAVLAILRLLDPPDVAAVAGEHPMRLAGAWLAPAAALGLLASMIASIRDERVPAAARGIEGASPEPRLLTLSGERSGGPPTADVPETGRAR